MAWTRWFVRRSSLLLLCYAALTWLVAASAQEPAPFIFAQRGEMPIILSAPHGGALPLPDVAVRDPTGKPRGGRGVVLSRDTGTEELARQLSVALEQRFGVKPYMVVARAHRRFVDMNRPPEIAYDDPDAKPVYDAYHRALKDFCGDVRLRFGRGLLLDLHGQGVARDTVFRGTQDGKTVSLLRQRFGAAAVVGEQSLFARLNGRGWKVNPDPLDGREAASFRGGYIVQTYGSHNGTGIDAVQLEFGADFRSPTGRAETAATLAAALREFAADFLGIPAPLENIQPAPPAAAAQQPMAVAVLYDE